MMGAVSVSLFSREPPASVTRARAGGSRLNRVGVLLALLLAGCARPVPVLPSQPEEPPEKLAAYGLFRGDGSTQEPAQGVVSYDIRTPLFTDYALKYRFVKLPPGTSAEYHETEAFAFPVGTILVKTFAYPHDFRDPGKGRRLIETRLLIHNPEGWVGLPYVWNEEQTEATLKIAGVARDVSWIHADGEQRTINYLVPNMNQCRSCHENRQVMAPIGPKARHLNKDYHYPESRDNQLAHWTRTGILRGAPAPEEAPRLAVWDDPATGSVEQRARAWLEVNCAHCHNPNGPARTSGLDLLASQAEAYRYGVMRTPVAAGRGSGGRLYDIVPGKPDESILLYRIHSTEPGVMMPELGRRLVDAEGAALVRAWIASLPPHP